VTLKTGPDAPARRAGGRALRCDRRIDHRLQPGRARQPPYLSLSPGMMLGETALLDGRGRSADAVADVASVVHVFGKEALERIACHDPELARQRTQA
jgi:CRP-like cAMP-binding protein